MSNKDEPIEKTPNVLLTDQLKTLSNGKEEDFSSCGFSPSRSGKGKAQVIIMLDEYPYLTLKPLFL